MQCHFQGADHGMDHLPSRPIAVHRARGLADHRVLGEVTMMLKQTFNVHVFRPSGFRQCIWSYECTTAQVAVRRAKKRAYTMGWLAHFYKFVAIIAPAPVTGSGS